MVFFILSLDSHEVIEIIRAHTDRDLDFLLQIITPLEQLHY